jgi:predicted nucleic acid-binding protein
VRLYGEEQLHRRALALAERFALPAAYDAHDLALAYWLGGEFWTADRRLVQAVGDELPWVRVVEV